MGSTTRKRSNPGGKTKHARGKRWLIAVSLAGTAIVTIAISGTIWYWASAPARPVVQSANLDPAVAASSEKARLAVQQEPRSGAAWGGLGMALPAHEFPSDAAVWLAQVESGEFHELRWP